MVSSSAVISEFRKPSYVVRHAVEDDFKLIHSSWFKASRETQPNNLIPKELFNVQHNKSIIKALDRGTVLVLCHPDDPSELFGYICYQRMAGILMVHWLYIRNIWRGYGLAGDLLAEVEPQWREKPLVITQNSQHLISLSKKFPKIVYDPYYLAGVS